MPAVYTYQLGPSHTQQGPSYHNYTILEKFAGPFTTNLKVTDLKPEYANRHGLDSDAKIAPHFFPGMGHFGTFVVDAQDQFIDHHYGMQGVDEARAQLVAPKDIEKTLIQTYESQPGQPLGTYEITRLQKHGETALKVKKRRL